MVFAAWVHGKGGKTAWWSAGDGFEPADTPQLLMVRSSDEGRTWSKPVNFDKCGVLPQLRVLGCGVSLAGYGRPGVFLRASNDPSGLKWEAPIDLETESSCCYTAILPLDDTHALFGYSDFRYPGPDGTLRKTILVRRVAVRI